MRFALVLKAGSEFSRQVEPALSVTLAIIVSAKFGETWRSLISSELPILFWD